MALPTFPRHLTLSADERARLGLPEPGTSATPHSRLVKQHQFTVTYPDGSEGQCRYERFGPAYHSFCYRYGDTQLPRQYVSRRLGNTHADIEAAGRDAATLAFAGAVTRERDEHFRRASPPPGSKPDPAGFQFSAKRAKQIAGQYALCVRLGAKLIPVRGELFVTLYEANAARQERSEAEQSSLVVACACRFSRRWEQPRYNPLRPHTPLTEARS